MNSRFITYVAAQDVYALTGQAVERALRMIAPAQFETVTFPSRPDEPVNILRIDGLAFAIMAVPAQLPFEAWGEAARRSVIMTDAAEVLSRTAAHVVIAAMEETDSHRAALRTARMVTLLAAAITVVVEGEAVIFTEGQCAVPPRVLIDEARAMERGVLPVMMWTTLQFFKGPSTLDGRPGTGAVTTGMRPFIGREIELAPAHFDGPDIARRVVNLCGYLLMQGPVVKDGETIGETNEERIRASTREEGQRPGIPILHLALEAMTAPPPPPEPVPFVQPITAAARFSAASAQTERVFGKRRWTGT